MAIIGKPGIGLMIGIPTLGRPVTLEWATAFNALNPPINFHTIISQVYGQHVAEARNSIVRAAIENDRKYLFFLSDDVIVPPHTLRQLIYRMEHDDKLGVVGGVYCSKSEPPSPLVFNGNGSGCFWDWKVGEYFPVTGLGMDCTLIRVETLKYMPQGVWENQAAGGPNLEQVIKDYKWFETIDDDQFLDGINKAEQWTEDLRFLDKLKDTDWKIMCDSMVMAIHYDWKSGKRYSLPKGSKPTIPLELEKKEGELQTVILDLGCGTFTNEELNKEGKVIRIDARKEVEPDYCCDIRCLPFDKDSVDIVYSSHVLEHFLRSEYGEFLEECLRVLKPGGELRIVVPNLSWAFEQIEKDPDWFTASGPNHVLNVLYGAQTNPLDRHYNGFTPSRLKSIFEKLDLDNVTIRTDKRYNIFGTGNKKSKSNKVIIEIDRTDSSLEELEKEDLVSVND
ncbi:hypothetical protein LCGC14_2322480 [marine sediment metagenome]|uniref:Uncharacterized protein n=1 Tax=marine sediment metagenome TaxID=412755 RepID=A0A0F9EUT2_9ZZZZ